MTKKKEEDCPAILIELARTPFEKQVAIEFVGLHKEMVKMKEDLKNQKWLIITTLGFLIAAFVRVCI